MSEMPELLYRFVSGGIGIYEPVDKDCPSDGVRRARKPVRVLVAEATGEPLYRDELQAIYPPEQLSTVSKADYEVLLDGESRFSKSKIY